MKLLSLLALACSASPNPPAMPHVIVDSEATLRWEHNGEEVALFGANYCLPSGLDFRAAGYVGADRKQLIEQDMAHFARMGFDGLRLSWWGDSEASDPEGNLKDNVHLDLLCWLIDRATRRGIFMMLSPIITYDPRWPEMQEDPNVTGFARTYDRQKLATDPVALRAQQNYWSQLLRHTNPYTGRALKDEPNILFLELINEPYHQSRDLEGSVRYLDAMVEAIRSTGCTKLTFHNLSQDFGIGRAIEQSKVDGGTFAWYPSGLNANRRLEGNFLRFVDDYRTWQPVEFPRKPRLVYEFDMPDVSSGYAYPAMVREFRGFGAQFAAMFSYDMLATAPYNLGWTTHLLNMVYTPKEAVSAMIAGEAMNRLPAGVRYGRYPQNQRFGPFRVSVPDDLAEMVTDDAFLHSNTTKTRPPSPHRLTRIAGYGSSPVVQTDSEGIWFLDKIEAGVWRLEVHPDSIQVADPYHSPTQDRLAFRLVDRPVRFRVVLPDLGEEFTVTPMAEGSASRAREGWFDVRPGVVVLSRGPLERATLPEQVRGVGLDEFVTPRAPELPPQVLGELPTEHPAGRPLMVRVRVIDADLPERVMLVGPNLRRAMKRSGRYDYSASLLDLPLGKTELCVEAEFAGGVVRHALHSEVVSPAAPLALFDAAKDVPYLATSRDGEAKPAPGRVLKGSAKGRSALELGASPWIRHIPDEFTVSLYVGDRVRARVPALAPTHLRAVLRAKLDRTPLIVTLVDDEGWAWAAALQARPEWSTQAVPLSAFKPAQWRMLPQSFPGSLSDRSDPALHRRKLDPRRIERVQFSIRTEPGGPALARLGAQLELVELLPDPTRP